VTAKRVCIVGGGAVGLACAAELAGLGCEVVVIEKGQLVSGSSGLSVGVYSRQYLEALDIQLRVAAYERMCELERNHGLWIRRNGYIRLAHDAATMEKFDRGVALQHELGVPDSRVVDARELAQLAPSIETADLAGGMYGPGDGYLDGHELCMTYATIATSRGASIRIRTELLGAEPMPAGGWRLSTSGGAIEADVVVNAAGAWADRVGEMLGTPIAIVPQRHQAVLISTGSPLERFMPFVMDYIPGSGEEGLYFRGERPDALIAGFHTNDLTTGESDDPDNPHRAADPDHIEQISKKLTERLPGLELSFMSGWSGIYPVSADGQIVVGPFASDPSVIAALGLDGVGVQLSPVVGRLVAEHIVFGEVRLFSGTEALLPGRFEPVLSA
jgi:glycine/D-amino acid oxidase-like deaminating enzyme